MEFSTILSKYVSQNYFGSILGPPNFGTPLLEEDNFFVAMKKCAFDEKSPYMFRVQYIAPQRYNQVVTGKYARSVHLLFVFPMLIHWKCNNIEQKYTLAKTGKIDRNCAARSGKSVQILTANLKYKLCILFFARYVSRICSIYVSFFRMQPN